MFVRVYKGVYMWKSGARLCACSVARLPGAESPDADSPAASTVAGVRNNRPAGWFVGVKAASRTKVAKRRSLQ